MKGETIISYKKKENEETAVITMQGKCESIYIGIETILVKAIDTEIIETAELTSLFCFAIKSISEKNNCESKELLNLITFLISESL